MTNDIICAVHYDFIYRPFPINSQYLRVDNPEASALTNPLLFASGALYNLKTWSPAWLYTTHSYLGELKAADPKFWQKKQQQKWE